MAERKPSLILKDALLRVRAAAKLYEKLGLLDLRVYGSVARGDDRPESDIDFLVDIDLSVADDPFSTLWELKLDLRKILKPAAVSVAYSQSMFPCVLREIAKDVRHVIPGRRPEWELRREPLPHDADAVIANRAALRVRIILMFCRGIGDFGDLSERRFTYSYGWCIRDIRKYGLLPEPPSVGIRVDRKALGAWAEKFLSAHPEIAERVAECEAAEPRIEAFREECEARRPRWVTVSIPEKREE